MRRRHWKIKDNHSNLNNRAQEAKVSSALAQVLLNRGLNLKNLDLFLNPSIEFLHSPTSFKDMDKAVLRIKEAIKKSEKVFVVGDYDVDGVTSLAIFHEFAKNYPGIFSFYIPHRVEEGYGLNNAIIKKAKDEEASLIIAFDCGTNAIEEIELATSLEMDFIIIDHHHPLVDSHPCLAFVNPKRKDQNYPFADLSAGAISFKLLQALTEKPCHEVLDLVALSIICDVAPLKGENRILLRHGLEVIKKTERLAIKALCQVSKIRQANIEAFHIGFILGPRINACGRIAEAMSAFELFTSSDWDKVYSIALSMDKYNRQRKTIESGILKEADSLVQKHFFNDDYAIVVSGDNWHQGVLGIVASRLADKYYRPAFVISFDDQSGKGSARSIHSVHLMETLDQCSGHLDVFGGHRKAAGIHIKKTEIEAFRKKINEVIKGAISKEDLIPILEIDAQLDFSQIDIKLALDLEQLKPFGEENSKPLFVTRFINKKAAGQKVNSGFSLWLSNGSLTFEGIVYDKDVLDIIRCSDAFDIVFTLERNAFHNVPKLVIKDARIANG